MRLVLCVVLGLAGCSNRTQEAPDPKTANQRCIVAAGGCQAGAQAAKDCGRLYGRELIAQCPRIDFCAGMQHPFACCERLSAGIRASVCETTSAQPMETNRPPAPPSTQPTATVAARVEEPPQRGAGVASVPNAASGTEAGLDAEERGKLLALAGSEGRLGAWLAFVDVLKEAKGWKTVVIDCSPSRPGSDLMEAVLNDEVWLDLSRGRKRAYARVLSEAWQAANRANQPDAAFSELNLRNHRGIIVAGYQRGRDVFSEEE